MTTKTFTCTRDARTSSTPSDYGAGACDHLCVGNYGGYDYHSHLGFTGLSWSGIPSAASISSAVLEVYTTDAYHVAFSSNTIRVREMNSSFSEGSASHPMSSSNSITGANRGSYSSTNAATFSGGTSQNTKRSVTITNLIKANFGTANLYLALTADSGVCEFWSRETSYDPRIVITYTAASVPNAPGVAVPSAVSGICPGTSPAIQITHSDAQSDPATQFDCQVFEVSGSGVVPAWPADDVTTGLTAWTYNNATITTPISWTVNNALTRGKWYAIRARTTDATGDGAWSSPVWVKVHGTLTVGFAYPSANTQVGPMFYDAASNTTPGFRPSWTFSCPEGHGLQSGTLYIKNSGGAVQNGGGSGEAVAAGSTSLKSAYRPANSTSTTYLFDLDLTCAGGLVGSATQRTGIKARWGRAAYKVTTTAATAYMPAAPASMPGSGTAYVMEFASSSGGTEPANWFASASDATPQAYLHYRLTILPTGGTPTSLSLDSVQLNWSNIVAVPYHWNALGTGCSVDTGQFLYGTQCLKIVALNGAYRFANQDIYTGIQPGQTYTLSAWVKVSGNARPYLEIEPAGGGSALAAAIFTPVAGSWVRLSVPWSSEGASSCRIVLGSYNDATTDAQVWFDAVKLEASTVVTPWQPGYVGSAVAIDAGGMQVDASAGGVFRLLGSAGVSSEAVTLGVHGLKHGVAEYGSGTAFPTGTLTAGDRYWRTDLRMEFFWDGTQWVSTQVFSAPLQYPDTSGVGGNTTADEVRGGLTYDGGLSSAYVEDVVVNGLVATSNNGSNYWPFSVRRVDGGTATALVTSSTASWTVATWTRTRTTIGQVFTVAQLDEFELQVTAKTGTPGAWYMWAFVNYRLIAT